MARRNTPPSPHPPAGRAPRRGGRGPRTPHRPPGRDGLLAWLYGQHAVAAALANPARRLRRLAVLRGGEEALARLLPDDRPALEIPPPEVMDREAFEAMLPAGAVHQGVALLADPLPALDLEDLLRALPSDDAAQARPVRVAVLDQVTDPRNVGAVLRSAAAFGLAAVVVQDRHAPEATAALAKAASGALERVPLIRATNLARALDRLKQDGFWCVGLDGRARDSLPRLAPVGRTALVLGSEGAGLRRLVRERCDLLARIPIGDGVESLNVAAAAAVAFYELAREDRD